MNERIHDETGLRQLLHDAAATLPPGDTDLFAQVAAGARHRRRRRLALLGTAGAVLVVAGALAAGTTPADRRGDGGQVRASGADRPCTARLEALRPSKRPGVEDVMVPPTPVSAVACFYTRSSSPAPGASDSLVLDGSDRLSAVRLHELVTSLNTARQGPVRCLTDAPSVAAVRFVYASGPDVEVRIGGDGCSNASNGTRDADGAGILAHVGQVSPTPRPSS
jgi:hypothetical protein